MRKTLSATVVGIEADASSFPAGAHAVTLDAFTDVFSAKRIRVPLLAVEEAKDLGRLYRERGAVRITIETVSGNVPEDECAASLALREVISELDKWEAPAGATPAKRLDKAIEQAQHDTFASLRETAEFIKDVHIPPGASGTEARRLILSAVESGERPTGKVAEESEVSPLRHGSGAEGPLYISGSLAKIHPAPGAIPPIVNGMPSCCGSVTGSPLTFAPRRGTMRWSLGGHLVEHCPYCGTRLPCPDEAGS